MAKYQEQLELARAKYEGHPEGKGMAYLANLELGNWLTESFDWDWYSTHTFANENTTRGWADRSWQRWLNSLILTCKAQGLGRPHYVRATEHQELRAGRTIHYHALVGGVGDIRRLLFKDLWEFDGFARVEKYDPGLGAGFYLGKYLVKGDSDIRFSHNLKRRNGGNAGVAISK
jgi:hypothetical protein